MPERNDGWMRMPTSANGTERWVADGERPVEIPDSLLRVLRLRDQLASAGSTQREPESGSRP